MGTLASFLSPMQITSDAVRDPGKGSCPLYCVRSKDEGGAGAQIRKKLKTRYKAMRTIFSLLFFFFCPLNTDRYSIYMHRGMRIMLTMNKRHGYTCIFSTTYEDDT